MWGYIHLISWVAIVVLTVTALLIYSKSTKSFTMLQMINRVFLYSGYFEWNYDGQIQHRAKLDSGNI